MIIMLMTVKVPGGKRRIAEGRRVASKKGRYTEVGFCSFACFWPILSQLDSIHRGMLLLLSLLCFTDWQEEVQIWSFVWKFWKSGSGIFKAFLCNVVLFLVQSWISWIILVISGFRIFPSGGDRGGGLLWHLWGQLYVLRKYELWSSW